MLYTAHLEVIVAVVVSFRRLMMDITTGKAPASHEPRHSSSHIRTSLHSSPQVTDAIFYGKDGKEAGQPPTFHNAIAQCVARVTDAAAARRVVAGDDAAGLGWFTMDRVSRVEAKQSYGTVAELFAQAIELDRPGLVSFDE